MCASFRNRSSFISQYVCHFPIWLLSLQPSPPSPPPSLESFSHAPLPPPTAIAFFRRYTHFSHFSD